MKKNMRLIVLSLILTVAVANYAGCAGKSGDSDNVDSVSRVSYVSETTTASADGISEVSGKVSVNSTEAEESVEQSREAVSQQSEESPVTNKEISKDQFGYVAKVDDNTYYWKYNKNTFKDGGSGYFGFEQGIANEFVCRDSGGNENTLFKSDGNGLLAVVNGRVFYNSSDDTLYVCDMDGKNEKVIGEGYKLVGMSEDGKYLICTDSQKIYSVDIGTEKATVLAEHGSYIAHHDNIVYYSSGNNEFYDNGGIIRISCVRADGTGQKDLYTDYEKLYDYSDVSSAMVGQMYFGDDCIYFSYGGLGGTLVVYQGGRIVKMKYDGSDAKQIEGAKRAEFSVDSDGRITEYQEDMPYSPMNDYCMVANNVCLIDRSNGERKAVISESDYSIVGNALPDKNGSNRYYINNVEQVGDKVYCLVHYGEMDESYTVGWRTGYSRVNSAFLEKDLTTGKVNILFKF